MKSDQCPELIELFNSEKFIDIFKKIIRIHDCNNIIITHIFTILSLLLKNIDLENINSIISFQRLREIFTIFKMNGFDQIHESIINLLKGILLKKTDKVMARNDKNKNNKPVQTSNISDEEYNEIITIFSYALIFLRNRIILMDFFKLSKWMYTVMTHLYTFSNIINNTNPKNLTKIINIITDKKIVEYMIECLYAINDKKVFIGIDNAFDNLDLNLINIKTMIFRALFHCLAMIKTLKISLPIVYLLQALKN